MIEYSIPSHEAAMTEFNSDSQLNPGQFKMIICIRRKPGMSKGEFQDYWLNQHGPLAARVQADGLAPPMLGYIQNHTVETAAMKAFCEANGIKVQPYDGITEVWLNDPKDLDIGADISQEVIAANQMLIDDEAKFVDLEHSRVFIVREHKLFMTPPKNAFYKMFICDQRVASLSREQFQNCWLNPHAAFAPSMQEKHYPPHRLGYVQNHTIDVPLLEPFKIARGMIAKAYDGIEEIWLNSIDEFSMHESANSTHAPTNTRLLNNEKAIVDFSNSSAFITVPHRIF